MRWLAWFLLLALGQGWARAEPPGRFLFKTYGPEQGFTESGLSTMTQDAQGFVWIGGDTGLVRYDGVSFRKWTAQDGLPSTDVYRVLPRRAGGIWVMTEAGVARCENGALTPLRQGSGVFQASRGSAMDEDAGGVLWALARDGLYRQSGDAMERVLPIPEGKGNALVCRAATGSVLALVGDQILELRRDGSQGRFTVEDGLPADGIETLVVDGTGRLWVVGTRLLKYQDPGEGLFRDASALLPAPPFRSCTINRETDGSVAIPTNDGLLILRGGEHEVLGQAEGLPSKWTASSLKDREGSLWVLGATLYRQLGRGSTRAFTSQDGLPSDLVWQVLRDRSGRLFAGTSEGVALLGARGWVRVPGTDALNVTCLVQDHAGRILIGSNNAVLRALEPGASVATEAYFRGFRGVGPSQPDGSTTVVEGRDGTLWLSDLRRGIYRLDPGQRTVHLEYGPLQAGVGDFSAWQLKEDREGRIWCASNCGALLHDGSGWHRFGRAQGLKVEPLNGIVLAADGSAWLLYREPVGISRATFRGGVFQVLETLDASSRLGSNMAYAGAVDAQGALWLGTDRGVVCLKGEAAFRVGRADGLAGDDCSQNAVFVDPGGDVWVGTSTGLARIVAGRRPSRTPDALTVALTQVIRGRTRLWVPFQDPGPVPHRDATLEFRFAAQTFLNEKAVQYQVRLRGLEEEWHATDVAEARYPALPAGTYSFEARACYPGLAYGPATSYAFQVLPPWWRTWWFLALEGLAAVGVLTLVMNWRLRTLAYQKERLAALVKKATGDLLQANHALEKANLALKAQSLTDPLTGLHNRRFLAMIVDDDVAQVQRSYRGWHRGQPLPNNDLVFLMVDLDHFKTINDTYGHAAGDRVLEAVARTLTRAARETDGIIRWGGEEFLVVARNTTRAEAHLLAERIRSLMGEQEVVLDSGEVLRWTCSVGYASYPFCLDEVAWLEWERVVEIADACLYLAKRSGRDTWTGAVALPGLERALHGSRLPWEIPDLVKEGVLEVRSSRG